MGYFRVLTVLAIASLVFSSSWAETPAQSTRGIFLNGRLLTESEKDDFCLSQFKEQEAFLLRFQTIAAPLVADRISSYIAAFSSAEIDHIEKTFRGDSATAEANRLNQGERIILKWLGKNWGHTNPMGELQVDGKNFCYYIRQDKTFGTFFEFTQAELRKPSILKPSTFYDNKPFCASKVNGDRIFGHYQLPLSKLVPHIRQSANAKASKRSTRHVFPKEELSLTLSSGESGNRIEPGCVSRYKRYKENEASDSPSAVRRKDIHLAPNRSGDAK